MPGSHLEIIFTDGPPLGEMGKSKSTFGFRPSAWEERALLSAEQVTGENRSEIIRRCVQNALPAVVKELMQKHQEALDEFNAVLEEQPATEAPGAHVAPREPEVVNYRKEKKK
jgi:hypothetical protein